MTKLKLDTIRKQVEFKLNFCFLNKAKKSNLLITF